MTDGYLSPPRKQERGRLRRESLLDAFLVVAAQQGILNLSLEQIAAHIGVAKATIYKHFSSKDEVIAEVYLRFYQPLWRQISELPVSMPVVPKLRLMARLYCEHHLRDPEIGAMIMSCKHFVEESKLSPEFAVSWRTFQEQRVILAQTIMARGIDEQLFRPLDARVLSEIGIRMLDGVLSCIYAMDPVQQEHLLLQAEDMLIKCFMRV
jgi:AcrR family transcriptional regulator